MELTNRLRSHAGPNLLLLALVHIALFTASLIAGAVLRHGSSFVNPYGSAMAVQQFFATNAEAVRASAFFFFGSCVPIGIFTATIVSRLHYLGVRAAGSYIALFGGFMTSGMIALSGFCSWVLSVSEVNASLPLTKALYFLSYLFGGVGFAVGFGLLVAGVSVTSYFQGLLPKWLIWFGLLIAIAGEFTTVSLVAYPMAFAIPFTRFCGFVWLAVVASRLAKMKTSELSRSSSLVEKS